ncbi:catechol 2,3-dioxygenase [Variovorax sp. 54]|uniref:VOC family protein n=1 Tax=Variovorax sp. 54 TaxID=2035212 RepID=UPI000C18FBF7|nr:VOC family protein [Variovorax sp. 54]PIF75261.1 catechol 2,3-dioxygenase [Variovorax sp. 54]
MVQRPRPQRLGHVVLNVRDLKASVRFYTEIVGLEVSDYIEDQMAFLRCGNDHHDLALAQIAPGDPQHAATYTPGRPGLEHFAYQLGSLAEIEDAARYLQAQGIDIVRGIGKHGPGENLFLVFKDPDGNYCEFYAEMVQITPAQPYTPRVWKNDLAAFDQWHFDRFVVPPPEWGPRTAEDEGDNSDNPKR